jgi:hypothetical protein
LLRYGEAQSQVAQRISQEVDMSPNVATKSPASAGDATFGQGPTFSNDVGFSLAVSPDKKAFTANFSGLEAVIDGKSASPIAARTFSFSIPLSDVCPGQEIPFFVSGFAFSEKGANAHLMFSVNDQTAVTDFPADSNKEFVQQLKYKAGEAAEARITVFLLADRDSKSDSAVHVNVTAIDTDILKHPS